MKNQHLSEATVTIEIEADLEAVWHALTTEGGLAAWMGAGSVLGSEPGDELLMTDVVSGDPKRGIVDDIRPLERIGYTWWSVAEPEHASQVAISLESTQDGTRVTVVEQRAELASPSADASVEPSARGGAWAWRTALLVLAAQSLFAHV